MPWLPGSSEKNLKLNLREQFETLSFFVFINFFHVRFVRCIMLFLKELDIYKHTHPNKQTDMLLVWAHFLGFPFGPISQSGKGRAPRPLA